MAEAAAEAADAVPFAHTQTLLSPVDSRTAAVFGAVSRLVLFFSFLFF